MNEYNDCDREAITKRPGEMESSEFPFARVVNGKVDTPCGDDLGIHPGDIDCLNIGDADLETRRNSYDDNNAPTVGTIMVPVKASYHPLTGSVYSFDSPTKDDIEKALKDQ